MDTAAVNRAQDSHCLSQLLQWRVDAEPVQMAGDYFRQYVCFRMILITEALSNLTEKDSHIHIGKKSYICNNLNTREMVNSLSLTLFK